MEKLSGESGKRYHGKRYCKVLKKFFKKSWKKYLTKEERCDIINKLSRRGQAVKSLEVWRVRKKFEKIFKKYLTNGKRCDIIDKSGNDLTASWKLNNAKKKVTTLEILLGNKRRIQAKNKKCAVITQALLNRIDFKWLKGHWYTTIIKSLILAQDERWRHA